MRTHRTRTILAVTLLATAICADRAAISAQPRVQTTQRIEAGDSTGGFARRLAVSLRHTVATVRLHQGRLDHAHPVALAQRVLESQAMGRVTEMTPFHFRLPPPGV